MPFNGSGTFVRLFSWAADLATGIKIRSDRMDGEMDGFATGLSTCITKDGQTTTTARIPFALGLQFPTGSVGSPATNFAADPDTGTYSPGSDQWAVAAGGAQRFLVNAGAISVSGTFGVSGATTLSSTLAVTGIVSHGDGTVGAPGIAFGSDIDCGAYRIGPNNWALATGGAKQIELSPSTGVTISNLSGTLGPDAVLTTVKAGNCLTWSSTNTNFVGSLGNQSGGGSPFIGLHAVHSSSANTLQNSGAGVRGMAVIYNGASLDFQFNGVATANAAFSSTITPLSIAAATGAVTLGASLSVTTSATMTTLNVTGNGIVSGTLGVNGTMNAATVQQGGSALVPPGTIMAYAGTSAPAGWLLCDGSVYNVSDHPALGGAVGSIFGGNGITTFGVPDLRGRTIFGVDAASSRISVAGSGIDATTIGASHAGGAQAVTIGQANLPNLNFDVIIPAGQGAHAHSVSGGPYYVSGAGASAPAAGSGGSANPPTSPTVNANTLPQMVGTAASGGSGAALIIMPPALILAWIIKR